MEDKKQEKEVNPKIKKILDKSKQINGKTLTKSPYDAIEVLNGHDSSDTIPQQKL